MTDSKTPHSSDAEASKPASGGKPAFFGQRSADDPATKHAFNLGRQSIGPMYADGGWRDRRWYDAPLEDPSWPEVHTYTDAMSYEPGEDVVFHSSTYAPSWSIEIIRDGLVPETVFSRQEIPGRFHAAPKDAYKSGCNWPESLRWTIPQGTRSGFFKVVSTCLRPDGTRYVQHHFFVVRPTRATRTAPLLMILPTSTWMAYNDWGGASSYIGIDGNGNEFSPNLSFLRPWTRGMVWLPEGAPRICAEPVPDPLTVPRYHPKDWAWSNGFGYFYAAAGWAQYDRHFVCWAERERIGFDMITQTDLHYRPEILDRYRAIVIVGHDEYWTHDMRKHVEKFVDDGGRLARFGGNYMWQVRLEDEGRRQVCYKNRAQAEDPVRGTDQAHLLSTGWESQAVNWPGATTVGVNGLGGIYASWGGFSPRNTKGFTVYRADHWIFDGTQLGYGDVFGNEANIFAYEVDGLDYTFRHGLPYPTGEDGAPTNISILAMSPALKAESMFPVDGWRYYLGESDMRGAAQTRFGDQSPESLDKVRYGSGMVVHMPRGCGEVVTAGTCEWIMGLKRNDFFTCQITRNVLDRFTRQA
ncbi:MAG: hypothetical protein J7549_03115 [Variovorax sp.]|nr:hypothetical protein [Variovorax sp.]